VDCEPARVVTGARVAGRDYLDGIVSALREGVAAGVDAHSERAAGQDVDRRALTLRLGRGGQDS
jgi:hypothetical protein